MYGILGQADLTASTNTTVYAVPAGKYAKVIINVCNRNTNAVNVRIALAVSDTPSNSEWIEYNTSIPSGGVLERGEIFIDNFRKIVVYSDTSSVSVNVYGEERVG